MGKIKAFYYFQEIIKKKGLLATLSLITKKLIPRIRWSFTLVGFKYAIEGGVKILSDFNNIQLFLNNFNDFWTKFFILFKSSRTFKFNGKKYNYTYRMYSITWNNERSVELPIIWDIVKKYNFHKVLEVGNVLSHFYNVKHDIVDKYEKTEGVINQDVVDFKPLKKYDLIVAISTLEHVGWDETPREPLKIFRAIENLKSLITENGKIIITLPKGHSPVLDNLLSENKLKFSEQYFLKRISRNNKWKQTNWKKISKTVYGYPIRYSANGIIIGIIK